MSETDPWLVSHEAIRRWTTHPDAHVRRWAAARWVERHPRGDLIGLGRLIMDPDPLVVITVADHLATCGERWVPVLVRAMELHGQEGRVYHRLVIARALGASRSPAAAPALLSGLRAARDGTQVLFWTRALGACRHKQAPPALLALLERLTDDDPMAGELATAVLNQGRRADAAAVVIAWRRMAPGPTPGVVDQLAKMMGLDRSVLRTLRRMSEQPASVALSRVGLNDPSLRELDDAPRQRAHKALMRRLATRRDEVGEWVRATDLGPPATDYRALVVLVEALLEALAQGEAVHPDETTLALAGLVAVERRCDEARALRKAADPLATAISLLRAEVDQTPTAVRDAIVSAGRRAVGPLAAVLDADLPDIVLERACALVRPLVAEGVAVDGLLPALAALADTRSGTPPGLAAVEALVAAGAPAVPHLEERLRDDPADDVLAALGRIATQASFDALVRTLHSGVAFDLRVAEAITDQGAPGALDELVHAWSPGLRPLAAMLEALATLYDVQHPLRPRWCLDLRADAVLRGVEAAES